MKNKLKDLRTQRSVSQNALAEALSVSRQTINSIENGKFDPSLTLAMKLTRFFEVSLDEIFIYKDELGINFSKLIIYKIIPRY